MIEVNLLPQRIIQRRRRIDFIIFVGICAVVAFCICYFFYLSLAQTIRPLEKRLSEVRGKIKEYQPLLKEIEKVKKENAEIQARFDSFKQIVERQSFFPRLLYFVYKCLPDNIWLEEIKSDRKENFIEITGKSLNKTIGVAEFIKNMEKSGLFSEIRFVRFSLGKVANREVMSFKIRCFLPSGNK